MTVEKRNGFSLVDDDPWYILFFHISQLLSPRTLIMLNYSQIRSRFAPDKDKNLQILRSHQSKLHETGKPADEI